MSVILGMMCFGHLGLDSHGVTRGRGRIMRFLGFLTRGFHRGWLYISFRIRVVCIEEGNLSHLFRMCHILKSLGVFY